MIGLMIFAAVVAVIVYVVCMLIDLLPMAQLRIPLKMLAVVIGIAAILYRLAPYAGMS